MGKGEDVRPRAVAGLDQEVARQAADAERLRRSRSLRWWLIGAALALVIGFSLGLAPSEEEVDDGAETTPAQIAGTLLVLGGGITAAMALSVNVSYLRRVAPALATPLGEGEIQLHYGSKTTHAEVHVPGRPMLWGSVSGIRYATWSPGDQRNPAVLFGSFEEGGCVVAVVGLDDGSTRAFPVRRLRVGQRR